MTLTYVPELDGWRRPECRSLASDISGTEVTVDTNLAHLQSNGPMVMWRFELILSHVRAVGAGARPCVNAIYGFSYNSNEDNLSQDQLVTMLTNYSGFLGGIIQDTDYYCYRINPNRFTYECFSSDVLYELGVEV